MRGFDWGAMWTPTWPPLEVALRAALVYLFVQLLLRLVGRKEMSRYSVFDIVVLFLVTTAARQTIVGDDSSLTSAFIGLTTIFGLDWVLSWLAFRSRRFARLIEGPVRQLVRDGELQWRELRRTRVSVDDLRSHLREKGVESLDRVAQAFLEPSGRISFVLRELKA